MKMFITAAVAIGLGVGCSPAKETSLPASTASIEGTWVGCDGREVTFTREQGKWIGVFDALGKLDALGFTVGERAAVYRENAAGNYSGQVSWRYPDGRQAWQDSEATVVGTEYSDTGSDDCSRSMRRKPTLPASSEDAPLDR